jgi:hypothetical protein
MKKICQSCGIPLSRDPNGGGTWADGKKSAKYCSFCFQRGQFTYPKITAKEMQTLVKDKLKENKVPGWIAWFLTRNIPYLERWRKSSRPR